MDTSRQLSRKRLCRLIAVVTFLLTTITIAQADPIVVSGSATLTSGVVSEVRGPVNITGTNFSASLIVVGGNFGLGNCSSFLAGLNGPCTSGSVGGFVVGTDLLGTFTVNGVTFNSNVINQMNLSFTGPSFLIPAELLGASAVQITAPFSFTGAAVSPALSEVVMLQGQGTVHVVLVRRTIGIFTGFFLDHADYVFGSTVNGVTVEEVPEPMTLVLLATGLGGGLIYRRKRAGR
ncbi:MAG TPA: PEP-CTERM sorting domain-containing protein [Pyrinomonadaceae bacterium]|nr:PEP-CTERM sorting domain-containing protein [Pyrinomonadaceae bacterium]